MDAEKEQRLRQALATLFHHFTEMERETASQSLPNLLHTLNPADVLATKRRLHPLPCVLVVEDDRFVSSMARHMLSEACEVKTAETAHKALGMYASLAPDITFLDINLPDENGFDVLRRLRILDPQGFIVMFSGNSNQVNVNHALKEGAQGFVAKPFTRQALMDCLVRSPHVANHPPRHL